MERDLVRIGHLTKVMTGSSFGLSLCSEVAAKDSRKIKEGLLQG